jgi:hypothetical protein
LKINADAGFVPFQHGGQGGLIILGDAGHQGVQANGPVHGPGVQVQDVQALGQGIAQGGFAGAHGAIHGNGYRLVLHQVHQRAMFWVRSQPARMAF